MGKITVMLDETTLLGRIVSFVMIGLLGWLAFTTYDLSLKQVEISTELRGVKELIVQMQMNYVTKSEAETRFTILQNTLDRMNDRIRALEDDKEL